MKNQPLVFFSNTLRVSRPCILEVLGTSYNAIAHQDAIQTDANADVRTKPVSQNTTKHLAVITRQSNDSLTNNFLHYVSNTS